MTPDGTGVRVEAFRGLVKRRAPLLAVGAWRDGEEHIAMHKHDGSEVASQDSIFEIGSVTKTFTALLLADMNQRGEVNLSDPLAKFIPTIPRRVGGREITLLDLATHTARLSRIPRDLLWEALRHRSDPYARYTFTRLEEALRRTRVKRRMGEKVGYSNFGFAALGYALAQAAGQSYEWLIAKRICEPLSLSSTWMEPPPNQAERSVQGHLKVGKPVPPWNLASFRPAGGLHSSVGDMLTYLRSHLDAQPSVLHAALEEVQRPRADIKKNRLAIGLGWLIATRKGRTLIWHGGATGGFSSFAGFNREANVALAALANGRVVGPLTRVGIKVLDDMCK